MNQGSNTTRIVLIFLVGASLLLNAFLLNNKYKQQGTIDTQTVELADLGTAQQELEAQYNLALTDLDEMKGNNTELNAMIEQQKTELTRSKSRIGRLLKDSKNLTAAREEIALLASQRDEYVAQIVQLQEENQGLVNTNKTLSDDKESLTANVNQKSTLIDEMESEKAVLMSQKNEVDSKNAE